MKKNSFKIDTINEKMIKELIKKFKSNIEKETSPNHYLQTYEFILSFARSIKQFDKKSFVLLTSMIYSWMPRVLKINFTEDFREVLNLLNKIRSDNIGILDMEQLHKIKNAVNNSLVGASKLLHFVKPEFYPIWDSKVASHFLSKVNYHQIQKTENYLEYRIICETTVKGENFKVVHLEVNNLLGEKQYFSSNTEVRTLELLMYLGI